MSQPSSRTCSHEVGIRNGILIAHRFSELESVRRRRHQQEETTLRSKGKVKHGRMLLEAQLFSAFAALFLQAKRASKPVRIGKNGEAAAAWCLQV